MLTALILMGALGLVAGVGLGVFSRVFYVYVDPRITEVEMALPGANCGGCGYAGCSACAEAIVNGEAEVNSCVAGGPDVAQAVGAIMGMEVGAVEPQLATHHCRGGVRADIKYLYQGIPSCRAAAMFFEGFKGCEHACLGFGDCVEACQFGAVEMGKEGLPIFYSSRCVGCGKCVEACPHDLIRLASLSDRLLEFNREDECAAPCKQTCPAQIDIQKYIELITEGKYAESLLKIKERNPLPLTCGRVCPHPCEDNCRRAKVDEAVDINRLKRFVADLELNSGKRNRIPCAPDTGKKVAIVGGGPAGLTAAFFLRRLGHSPTIFDMMPKLGGMLRYGIPEYRYPKAVLDWEIQGILDLGVEARTDLKFGRDYSIETLRLLGYEAIFLAIGAWTSTQMGAEGEDLPGVYGGIEYLIEMGLGNPPPLGKTVYVIGGGNTAIDAARTAKRMGSDVTILYRRTRKEMPANEIEIDEAIEEDIQIHYLAAPTKLFAGEDGKVNKMEYIEMELGEPDASGRRRPVPKKGSEKTVDVDNVIAAIGQRPDMGCVEMGETIKDITVTRWNTWEADEGTLQTKVPYVFTGGDVFTGPDLVVSAIGAGRRVARSIHLYLNGQPVTVPPSELRKPKKDTLDVEVYGVEKAPRLKPPHLDPAERVKTFEEVAINITEDVAIKEADRCLRCGFFCYDRILEAISKVA